MNTRYDYVLYTTIMKKNFIAVLCFALLEMTGCATVAPPKENGQDSTGSLSDVHQNIIQLIDNQEYEHAHQIILQELESSPDDSMLHYHLGLLLLRRGLFQEAEPEFRKTLDLDKNHPQALFNLGVIKQKMNNLEEARKLYTKALAITPDDPDTHYNLAIVYDKLFKKENALYHYKKCIGYFQSDRTKRRYIRAMQKRIDELEYLLRKEKS
ncbi:tetratricopeptide repeat protein [bacterium]|nr:tetratricopeptide repeat protein [bacterium]MCP5462871.1 tetratricopeptide repeat protein [bacterium]